MGGALTVTINAGQHNISQAPSANGFRCVLRFVWIQGWRRTGSLHRTKSTATSAGITHQLKLVVSSINEY